MIALSTSRHAALSILATALLVALGGCDGCTASDLMPGGPTSGDDIEGHWIIDNYAFDNQGCEPIEGESPFSSFVVEGGESSDGDALLTLLACPSTDACPETAPPENELRWDADYERGEYDHHAAELIDAGRTQPMCHLTAIQTLLLPAGNRLEMTRSHHEMTLPVENDDTCTADLAEEYRPQMRCARSEHIEFVTADDRQRVADE